MITPEFEYAKKLQPEIIVIFLGLCDTKATVWQNKEEFKLQYKLLIQKLKQDIVPSPDIFIASPSPIRDDHQIEDPPFLQYVNYYIMPNAVQEVAWETGVHYIDIFNALGGKNSKD
jgi:hypothetical protein